MSVLGQMKKCFDANLTELIENKSGNSSFKTKENYSWLKKVI